MLKGFRDFVLITNFLPQLCCENPKPGSETAQGTT
jgi:hypothetical protein